MPADTKGVTHVFMAGIDDEAPVPLEVHRFACLEPVLARTETPVVLMSPRPLVEAVPRLVSTTFSISTSRRLVFLSVTPKWQWS